MDIGFGFRLQDTDFQYLDQYLINICPPNQLHPTGCSRFYSFPICRTFLFQKPKICLNVEYKINFYK